MSIVAYFGACRRHRDQEYNPSLRRTPSMEIAMPKTLADTLAANDSLHVN
ncbi:hypothetical protein [Mesorhizobium sophorae]|nr:hypothetical protein [Mesorhizobium sophorae]